MARERINKVAQAIKEEVAQILQHELKDPRIGFVTITRVNVTPDLHYATIYFSLLEGHAPGGVSGAASDSRSHAPGGVSGAASSTLLSRDVPQSGASASGSHGSLEETEKGLQSAHGYIRRLLGERLRLRVTPEVSFRSDPSVAESIRISKILGDLKKEGKASE